ncbi:MAG: GNAT family N-acetyltransferase [Candidatus Dormibacteria bacterium]
MADLKLPIQTERLRLRQLQADDLDPLSDIHSRPDVVRYLYWEPRNRDQVRRWLEGSLAIPNLARDADALVLAVEELSQNQLIGTVNFFLRSVDHRQGEIGFVFHPDFQGQGLAQEAATELLRLGFETLRLHRILGRCDGRNLRSARLMERLGMTREAVMVENEWVKGEWTDEWIYAIREQEWRELGTDARA